MAVEREWFAKEEFVSKIRDGILPLHAALEVGWSPYQLRRFLAEDRDFADLVETAEQYRDEGVEMSLYELARGRHFGAVQMILFNRMPERWADRRQIEVRAEHTVVHVIETARDALKETLLAAVDRRAAIAELQQGGVLDVEAVDVTDSGG